VQATVEAARRLWFGPGDPVRAASAVAPLGDGWLVAQDDANHAGWWRPTTDVVERVRLFPPRDGLDLFGEADGTKHLKPDLEAGCAVGPDEALLLGSGSLPARTRVALVRAGGRGVEVRAVDLAPVYDRIRVALGLAPAQLNLEGACAVGDRLRWFQRGHGPTGVPSASVDLPLDALLGAVTDGPREVEVRDVRRYELGSVAGLPLAITDAVVLPDGRICVSATAEDAPDAVADGPVLGSVLAVLGDRPHDVEVVRLPDTIATAKIEGLALRDAAGPPYRLLAVVDDDDPTVASQALDLTLDGPAVGATEVARSGPSRYGPSREGE
jgi:hypothetical protein